MLLGRAAAAGVMFIAAWVLHGSMPRMSLVLSILSVLTAGYDRILRAVAGCVRGGEIGEELLMTISIVAAFAIERWLEGAFGMLLLQIGALVQGCAEERCRRGLEDAQVSVDRSRKARTEEFNASFTRYYTPSVLGIAVVMAVGYPLVFHATVQEGVYRALLLMVIACPCAFVVSVPLTYRIGLGAAARQGLRIRSTGAEDALRRVDTIVLDQGPILEGEGLRVLSVKSERMDADTFLRIAAHACAYSDGIFARAIKAAYQDTIYIELIQSFQEEPDHGITVEVEDVPIVIGAEDFVREHGVDPGEDSTPECSVYLGINGSYAGRILLGSVAKRDAADGVTALSWESDREIILFSEDSPSAAEKFARSVGISVMYADCNPERRRELMRHIAEDRRKRSALLYAGDPATDPECFAAADVSLAASGEADILADDPGPMDVFRGIDGAKRVHAIVTQHIVGALAFKLVVLLMDILGACPLWLAVFADAGVTLAGNIGALRAMNIHASLPTEKEE